MRLQKIAVSLLALAVAALAGVLMGREAFRLQNSSAPPASSLESGCKSVTDTECVGLTNRCHRRREAEACRALARLPHMATKLENVRKATSSDPGHPAHAEARERARDPRKNMSLQ